MNKPNPADLPNLAELTVAIITTLTRELMELKKRVAKLERRKK